MYIKQINNTSDGQIKAINKEKGIVTIYVNAFGNEDTDGDISMPGSFEKTIKENQRRIRHFLNHSWQNLVGVPISMKEDAIGLLVESKLNLNTELGRDVFENYKLYAENNRSLEHSVGLEAMKYEEQKTEDGRYIRQVNEWKLWEYSTLYGWGANQNTPMIGMKSQEDLAKYIDDFEFMLKKGNFSDAWFKNIELKLKEIKALIQEPHQHSQEPHQHSDNKSEPLGLDYMLNKFNLK
jgi:HK97 family phage prohead protease